MGGGLMQLVAYGAQDVYLTGNPQITFFKVVYRRHTNFAVEAIEQTFNGTPNFGAKSTVQITRNGDLVTKMYLKTTVTSEAGGVADVHMGNSLIKSVELQIGGTKIDKHYGHWLNVWSELTLPAGKEQAYLNMVSLPNGDMITGPTLPALTGVTLHIPLQFFCCRNDGLALPLIALQYHDVRLEFEFNSESATTTVLTDLALSSTTLLVDYIYLDSEERKRFAQASHEYLIEQVQHQEETVAASASAQKFRLNFNHPVKELVFAAKDGSDTPGTFQAFGVSQAQLKLNGHDRMQEQNGDYFRAVQVYQHHTRTPVNGIYVYSFALNPEEHQPSGSCNFSRIDNAELNITPDGTTTQLHVYAVNYNVLRIMSGMGGLAYSN